MDYRRRLRERKRAQRRLFGNTFLAAIIILAVAIIGMQVLSWGVEDDSVTGPIQVSAGNDSSGGVAQEKDLLILVNKDNKLPEGFSADIVEALGIRVDGVVVDDLKAMRAAAQRAEVYLSIGSAYRSAGEQERAFNEAVADFVSQGNSKSVAIQRAEDVAAMPGYSEHETGLAIDFSHDGSAEKRAEMWEWLKNNAWKYGFVLRYPEGKWFMTGYSFEPWHYRYVGQDAAKKIYEQGIVLEEYLGVASDVSAQQTLMISSAPGSLPLDNINGEITQAEEG